jgi:hypothetical protein
MHTRTIDLARTAACWRDEAPPSDLDTARHVSALVWIVPLVAFWVIVGLALT